MPPIIIGPGTPDAPGRYPFLDGCRGMAALFVANYHWACAFAPALIPEYASNPLWIADTPIAIAWNGGFAVAIFFVLSGFVIAGSAARRHLPLPFNFAQRYVRLALPALASTLIGYALLNACNGTPHLLKAISGSRWLDFVFDGNIPPLHNAFYSGLVDIFVVGGSYFNNVLWTMRVELIGSWLVYVLYGLWPHRKSLPAVAAALLLALIALRRPEVAAFMAGVLLREAVGRRRLRPTAPRTALFVGVVLGAMSEGYATRVLIGMLHLPLPALLTTDRTYALGAPHAFWHLVGAVLVIYALLTLPWLQWHFASPVARFMGHVSFGFYLVHAVLLYTLIGRLFLAIHLWPGALALIYAAFIGAALACGLAFTRWVDDPVMAAIHRAQRRWRG